MKYREPDFLPWDGRRVPITFVGGYLGAGKTTAINAIIAHADRPTAVIVNDVGAINVDAALIRRRHGDTIEVSDGCICCSALDGFGAAFDQIRARAHPPDHVIVELSGVAEPARLIPWAQSAGFMLDGTVIVVAADQLVPNALPDRIMTHLITQIGAADLIVFTKSDLLGPVLLDTVRARLTQLAGDTPVITSCRDAAETGAIGRLLALGGRRSAATVNEPTSTLFDAHQVHTVDIPMGLTCAELHDWLAGLSSRVPGLIVRAKGIVETTDTGLVLVQVVGARCEISVVPQPELQDATALVVISIM